MGWPPEIGEPLPLAAEASGVREKLAGYSLNESHYDGGPKARGFARILGITIAEIEYLSGAIEAGILEVPISDVRDNAPYGVVCEVLLRNGGLGSKGERIATVTTAWELAGQGSAPRLVNAYISD